MHNNIESIQQLQQEVDHWIKKFGVRYYSELTNTAILMEEVGELARVMARKYGEQSFKAGEEENMGEEMADILFVLLCLANQTGVNLGEAWVTKMDLKAKRDAERHQNNEKLK